MKYLRTISTRRLLALVAGVVIAAGGGTAIAVAAAGSGPVPPREPLAVAIHQALSAKRVVGITARITFTNNLISSSDFQGGPTDPLLQGASGRLWLSLAPGARRLRIELQTDNGDGQVVVDDNRFWIYDPASNTAYEGTLPSGAQSGSADRAHAHSASDVIPSIAKIQSEISKLAAHVNLSGAIPSDVAGQATYTVRVSPKHDGGLLGDAQLAWDAARGVPLRFAVYATNSSTPVLELKATDVSFGAVPASVFTITPPSGAKIVRISTSKLNATTARIERNGAHARRALTHRAEVTGAAAVARRLPFALNAPATLVGLPRRSVSLLDWGGKPAALVTYGQNLGGIVVLEQSAGSSSPLPGSSSGGDHRGLTLPTVSINGVSGQELDTALGTLVRFTRAGVAYTVVGSVPAAAADAAARGL
jgi:outer membrane lipoprotein-sorting protein